MSFAITRVYDLPSDMLTLPSTLDEVRLGGRGTVLRSAALRLPIYTRTASR